MDGQNIYTVNGTPIPGKEEYIFWSTRMEIHLKALGHDVWNSVITDYFPPNRVRTPTQKKSKKSNSMEMNTILDGLPDDVKEKIGECNSAKELWDKIKDLYSDEKSNEAYQSEQSSVYNNSSDEDSFEEDSDIEAEVNIEAELECTLDELRKYKQRCKQLKDLMLEKRRKQGSKKKELEKIIVDFRIQVQLDQERLESLEQSLNKEQQKVEELKQQQLESEEENQTLKRQLMSSQEELHSSRQQATISMEEAKNLKQEVVGLKDQLKTVEKFKKGTEALDKILSLQRFPSNKSGLGYDQVHMVKGSSPITQIDVEDDKCCDDTFKETTMQQKDDKNANSYAQESAHPPKKSNLKRNSNHKQEDQKTPKYKSASYGYCFYYGHKVVDCRTKRHRLERQENTCSSSEMKDPNNKTGLGYVKKESTIPPTFNTNKKELTNKFIFRRSSQMFKGYCYSCNNYGHKVSDCQAYGKHNKIRRNHNPCGPLPNYLIECYNCHNYGHISRRCTTRPPRPRYTKVWRIKSEVQNKNNDEDPTLEIDGVSKEEKHVER
jgi:hypothetical protein